MSLLEVSGISLQEHGNLVLHDISFTQQEYQKIAIAGETGSGKSTLLQTIAGLVQPGAGKVLFENKRVKGPQEVLVPGHEGIVYLSQQFELPQYLRVEQVLRYANTLSDEDADQLFTLCRIDHLMHRRTDHLSGGERQRIAMARLLLSSPRLFLLDEPFSNLDTGHKTILKTIIRDVGNQLGISWMLISHDPLDTLSCADEILVMQAGKLIHKGTPRQIYQQPVNEYAAALFGAYNILPAKLAPTFSEMFEIKFKSKKLLIRPESFKIVPKASNALSGNITKVVYYGSYSELEVAVAKTTIKVKTPANFYQPDDSIWVTCSPDDVWYI